MEMKMHFERDISEERIEEITKGIIDFLRSLPEFELKGHKFFDSVINERKVEISYKTPEILKEEHISRVCKKDYLERRKGR